MDYFTFLDAKEPLLLTHEGLERVTAITAFMDTQFPTALARGASHSSMARGMNKTTAAPANSPPSELVPRAAAQVAAV